jgi:chemotaxis protein CheY-P-specific phosphatase CheC
VGVELAVASISVEGAPSVTGDVTVAMLPLSAELDGSPVGELALLCPLDELATLARRMLDDPEPDKVRALSRDERDAVGEVLNLMSGALDAAVREALDERMHARPRAWRDSSEPGGTEPASPAEFALAHAVLQISGAGSVRLWLRVPAELATEPPVRPSTQRRRVLLLGLAAEQTSALEAVLSGARFDVAARPADAPDLDEVIGSVHAILLGGGAQGGEVCRSLRLANGSWAAAIVACLEKPSRADVIQAMSCGASHVLALPASQIDVLRVLELARTRG